MGEFFWQVGLGFQPSYTSRTLWGVHDRLKDGMLWCIGDGSKVMNWGDHWLLGTHGNMVWTAPILLNPEAYMQELIDHDTMSRRHDMLQLCFNTQMQREILTISLPQNHEMDSLSWRMSNDREFIIKMVYCLAREAERKKERKGAGTEVGCWCGMLWLHLG